VPVPNAASFACTSGGTSASGSAFASAGVIGGWLRGSASESGGPTGHASAAWSDVLRVTPLPGGAPVFARIGVHFDGSLAVSAANFSGFAASAAFSFNRAIGRTWGANAEGLSDADFTSVLFSETVDGRLALQPSGFLEFPILLEFQTEFGSRGAGAGGPVTGGVENDFASTGKLVSLTFLDAAGQPFAGPVQYSFVHGTQVHAAVPEPGTLALLLGGTLALAALCRGRFTTVGGRPRTVGPTAHRTAPSAG
jgi:hypothetical protein